MKRILVSILLSTVIVFTACAGPSSPAAETKEEPPTAEEQSETNDTEQPASSADDVEAEEAQDASDNEPEAVPDEEEKKVDEEAAEEAEAAETRIVSEAELNAILSDLPMTVKETNYVVQDDQYKSLYPDMLQVIFVNNSEQDIRDATVAFMAWDSNNLPVKIKGNIDFGDGAYVQKVGCSSINLTPGQTYGDGSGFPIKENDSIKTVKALVVDFETFDGDVWENPYFDAWIQMYEGKKLKDGLTAEVPVVDDTGFSKAESSDDDSVQTVPSDLDNQISSQEIRVVETMYTVQDEQYKSLYPDLLQTVIKNDTEYDIKDAVVAFAAWDKNKLPVQIKTNTELGNGVYVKEVSYSDINLIPGATYGEGGGLPVDDSCEIKEFKAIVVSYDGFDGEHWDNPLYPAWRELYEGKKLGAVSASQGSAEEADCFEVTCIGTLVNVREKPSFSSSVVAQIDQGDTFRTSVTAIGDGDMLWYKITLEDGNVGYVREDFLSVERQ